VSVDLIVGKFIRGAAWSKSQDAIFLIEANHNIYSLSAQCEGAADNVISMVEGAQHLDNAQVIDVEQSPAAVGNFGNIRHSSQRVRITTTKGCVVVLAASYDIPKDTTTKLALLQHIGYPPEDGEILRDFKNSPKQEVSS
jgi:hypothetical protein